MIEIRSCEALGGSRHHGLAGEICEVRNYIEKSILLLRRLKVLCAYIQKILSNISLKYAQLEIKLLSLNTTTKQ
jgi:hypothetical protein